MDKHSLAQILETQREFQKLAEVNIDTIVASEINALSEMYLFKAIEEIIELRKTFPSELNKWSKTQGDENLRDILSELSDVALFLMNFILARKISLDQLLEFLPVVQEHNFMKLKRKKLDILNDEMSRVPNKRVGFGGGDLMPAVIIIGQNPGKSLNEENSCWENAPTKSAVGFLKRAIKIAQSKFNLELDDGDFYFTNVVKEVTEDNAAPSHTTVKFWIPFLMREIEIISAGLDPIILAMGREAGKAIMQEELPISFEPLQHPSYYMREGFSETQYAEQLVKKLTRYVKDGDGEVAHVSNL
jgi:uracil-DNA glycosylase family 4